MSYSEKLRDPRWQKKRLKILERDRWQCQACHSDSRNLQVHHLIYRKVDPWDYPDECYQTLCEDCHVLRQQAVNHLMERLRMDFQHIPNFDLQFFAHFMSTALDAFVQSTHGQGILDHGLFTDAAMDLFGLQIPPGDSPRIQPLRLGAIKQSLAKAEAAGGGK